MRTDASLIQIVLLPRPIIVPWLHKDIQPSGRQRVARDRTNEWKTNLFIDAEGMWDVRERGKRVCDESAKYKCILEVFERPRRNDGITNRTHFYRLPRTGSEMRRHGMALGYQCIKRACNTCPEEDPPHLR